MGQNGAAGVLFGTQDQSGEDQGRFFFFQFPDRILGLIPTISCHIKYTQTSIPSCKVIRLRTE